MIHPLHTIASQEVQRFLDHHSLNLLKDPACGGKQNLPFFIGKKKSLGRELSNVDLFIAKDNQIILVCEIDESNVRPGHIFGKFLSLVSTDSCILKDGTSYYFGESLVFIQIVSSEKLKTNSKKPEQWQNIENSIRSNFQNFRDFLHIDYHILIGNNNGLDKGKLHNILQSIF